MQSEPGEFEMQTVPSPGTSASASQVRGRVKFNLCSVELVLLANTIQSSMMPIDTGSTCSCKRFVVANSQQHLIARTFANHCLSKNVWTVLAAAPCGAHVLHTCLCLLAASMHHQHMSFKFRAEHDLGKGRKGPLLVLLAKLLHLYWRQSGRAPATWPWTKWRR